MFLMSDKQESKTWQRVLFVSDVSNYNLNEFQSKKVIFMNLLSKIIQINSSEDNKLKKSLILLTFKVIHLKSIILSTV